ncbi:MAG: ergothioneine biosynthesis protein EgtB [Pseudomonadota bacterium]|nr:ergothioneine biosynthesis protein EgtB [Pseudomonadota bacterium]
MHAAAPRKSDQQDSHSGAYAALASESAGSGVNAALRDRYTAVRAASLGLCQPLSAEDACAQSMADASPAKWHLAHTSWFFETLVLGASSSYRPFDPAYAKLFNSYYQQLGKPYARSRRGLMTRPAYTEVLQYRAHVDQAIVGLLEQLHPASQLCALVELGLHHEQQHQELMLTDIKHLFWRNPLRPAYCGMTGVIDSGTADPAPALTWQSGPSGVVDLGHAGGSFAFDNEGPRHQVVLTQHAIASRPVSNREFRRFIHDDGYQRPELWLAEGWASVQKLGWRRPLYWAKSLTSAFTLYGEQALQGDAAVCHLSYYEADAYARWSEARLPTEAEWEASAVLTTADHTSIDQPLQPGIATHSWFGQVWNWTSSAYQPYPGYQPAPGAIGEYNGKFMCRQMVLRGSSCITARGHARLSYRNFFPPHARWQFAGLRLARDL